MKKNRIMKEKNIIDFLEEKNNKKKRKGGKPRLIKNPKKLTVYIPEEVDRDLRELIALIHGSYQHGLLSYEITNAIRFYIWELKNEKKMPSSNILNPKTNIYEVAKQIGWEIEKMFGGEKPQQITLKHLRMAIINVRGCSTPTIKRWLRILEEMKFIKHLRGQVFENLLP